MQNIKPEKASNSNEHGDTLIFPKQGKDLNFQILGEPGSDNALYVRLSTGKSISRFLFDCGSNCLSKIAFSEIAQIDYLLFSHLHIDHVSGFDDFLRVNYNRQGSPVRIYGPEGTNEIIQHRLQGVCWDRVDGCNAEFHITDILQNSTRTYSYQLHEKFKKATLIESKQHDGILIDDSNFKIKVLLLDHGTPSVGYILKEQDSLNVDPNLIKDLGLKPGPWLKSLKDFTYSNSQQVLIGAESYNIGELRAKLLSQRSGESIAYLTDFRLNEGDLDHLSEALQGCDTIICENNYRTEHAELANKYYHSTSEQIGALALRSNPKQLVLFHLSDRYNNEEKRDLLREVRESFPNAYFPEEWKELYS